MAATAVFLPGGSHRQSSLTGYSPWGHRVRQDWVTEHTSPFSLEFSIRLSIPLCYWKCCQRLLFFQKALNSHFIQFLNSISKHSSLPSWKPFTFYFQKSQLPGSPLWGFLLLNRTRRDALAQGCAVFTLQLKALHTQSHGFCYCSVTKSCPTLCGPMDCSSTGFLVLHCIPEFAQTRAHWIGDSI